jgi:RNA polymerase sigma-70 factor (ECF subfamily)
MIENHESEIHFSAHNYAESDFEKDSQKNFQNSLDDQNAASAEANHSSLMSLQEQKVQSLLLKSLDGDQRAYEFFLKEISTLVRKYIRGSQRGTIAREKLEDLVQEVLISIHTKLSTYRADLPVVPWVLAIAKNRVIDSSRLEKRRSQYQSLNFEIENFLYPKLESDLSDQFSKQQELESVLSHLSERQRQVLVLAKAEQFSIVEIAEKFKMSISAVKVTMHRAVGALRMRKKRRT